MDYREIDDFVVELSRPKLSSADIMANGAFLIGMKKVAMDDLLAAAEGVPAPSPYAVPVEQFVAHCGTTIGALYDLVGQCRYYEAALPPSDVNSSISSGSWLFESIAADILRHVSLLGPITLPPTPAPLPTKDPLTACDAIAMKVHGALRLVEGLRGLCGDAPFVHVVTKWLPDFSNRLDSLARAREATAAAAPVAEKVARLAMKLAAQKRAEIAPLPTDVLAPPLGSESIDAYLLREQELTAQQLANENQFLRGQLQQTQQHAAAQAAQAAQLDAQTQELNMQLEQTTQGLQEAQMQAAQNLELASSAESNAAAQADAKMRLSMRIQQMRQTMADIVSTDPAAEEGAGFPEQAGPGAPVTSVQQQQQAEQAAAEAEAAGGAPVAPGEATQEVEEADRAAQHAEVQGAQAEQAAAKVGSLLFSVRSKVAASTGIRYGMHKRAGHTTAGRQAGKPASDPEDHGAKLSEVDPEVVERIRDRSKLRNAMMFGGMGAAQGGMLGTVIAEELGAGRGGSALAALGGGALLGGIHAYAAPRGVDRVLNKKLKNPALLGGLTEHRGLNSAMGGFAGAVGGGTLGALVGNYLGRVGRGAGVGALLGGAYGAYAGDAEARDNKELRLAIERGKHANATKRLLAADQLSSEALSHIPDDALANVKAPKPEGLGLKGRFHKAVRNVGRELGHGMIEGANADPKRVESLGGSLARGGGQALDESLHSGKMMGYVRKANDAVSHGGKAALVLGGAGVAGYAGMKAIKALKNRKAEAQA